MNTPKGSSVLDQWEAEAKEYLGPKCSNESDDSAYERILALIDLVRKKDEALNEHCFCVQYDERGNNPCINCAALALTEKLK